MQNFGASSPLLAGSTHSFRSPSGPSMGVGSQSMQLQRPHTAEMNSSVLARRNSTSPSPRRRYLSAISIPTKSATLGCLFANLKLACNATMTSIIQFNFFARIRREPAHVHQQYRTVGVAELASGYQVITHRSFAKTMQFMLRSSQLLHGLRFSISHGPPLQFLQEDSASEIHLLMALSTKPRHGHAVPPLIRTIGIV